MIANQSDIRLGIVRGISYGLFGKPDEFVPQARALGAALLRVYVYWGQIEPEPGNFVWDPVDALLAQLDGDEEVWITVCSSSPWATRESTDFLPPSPARDPQAYGAFVHRLVSHCAGRVHYWQCDNEPSNTGLLWAGTAEEYVTQLTTMHRAVKDADPGAAVVLGGCGFDVFSSDQGSAPRAFFDHLVAAGQDAFDLFDAHLYGDPARVPDYLEMARQMMRAHGYLKPIVVGEHAGPILFEYPDVAAAMQDNLAAAFAAAPTTQSTDQLKALAGQQTPERRAMATMYARMSDLPPKLQMFMAGCPPELDAERDRLNCCQIVMRNLLALSEGVRRTAYWNLAPEVPAPTDPYQIMYLMFGKLPLLDYDGTALSRRRPAADAFALMAEQLADVTAVTRVEIADQPSIYAFDVQRTGRGPMLVLWGHRDEGAPPITVRRPWQAYTATAIDALGMDQVTSVRDGVLAIDVSSTPVFVSA